VQLVPVRAPGDTSAKRELELCQRAHDDPHRRFEHETLDRRAAFDRSFSVGVLTSHSRAEREAIFDVAAGSAL
jgi:hypothetical protein